MSESPGTGRVEESVTGKRGRNAAAAVSTQIVLLVLLSIAMLLLHGWSMRLLLLLPMCAVARFVLGLALGVRWTLALKYSLGFVLIDLIPVILGIIARDSILRVDEGDWLPRLPLAAVASTVVLGAALAACGVFFAWALRKRRCCSCRQSMLAIVLYALTCMAATACSGRWSLLSAWQIEDSATALHRADALHGGSDWMVIAIDTKQTGLVGLASDGVSTEWPDMASEEFGKVPYAIAGWKIIQVHQEEVEVRLWCSYQPEPPSISFKDVVVRVPLPARLATKAGAQWTQYPRDIEAALLESRIHPLGIERDGPELTRSSPRRPSTSTWPGRLIDPRKSGGESWHFAAALLDGSHTKIGWSKLGDPVTHFLFTSNATLVDSGVVCQMLPGEVVWFDFDSQTIASLMRGKYPQVIVWPSP